MKNEFDASKHVKSNESIRAVATTWRIDSRDTLSCF